MLRTYTPSVLSFMHEDAPILTCSSWEGIANPQTMRASFGEPQPLRMTRVVIVTFINRTTPPDCHGRGSGIATTEGSMSEMKVTILFLRAQILRWCSRMTARLVLIALSVVFIHERHRSELGEEMPRIARRDMFASGKRDIQKCDMFARLTRYALRASKASSVTDASLGLILKHPTNQYKY